MASENICTPHKRMGEQRRPARAVGPPSGKQERVLPSSAGSWALGQEGLGRSHETLASVRQWCVRGGRGFHLRNSWIGTAIFYALKSHNFSDEETYIQKGLGQICCLFVS